jgi:hypothetical protein
MSASPRVVALVVACALLTAAAGALAPACSLPEGQGGVSGTLDVPTCWQGKFDLEPDFFAGVPYRNSLQLRIQRGGDYETFSDGISILIDDITKIRPSDDGAYAGLYNVPLTVSLPAGVTPPGVPITANPTPAGVHLTLYLQRSCRTQNIALYAMDEVLLNADGTCQATDGSSTSLACSQLTPARTSDAGLDGSPDGGAATPDAASDGGAAPMLGRSTITFQTLFDGDADEAIAAKRLNQGSFHVYLADPREICPGGLGPPPRCRGELTGNFNFYFSRGRPAQPFP